MQIFKRVCFIDLEFIKKNMRFEKIYHMYVNKKTEMFIFVLQAS